MVEIESIGPVRHLNDDSVGQTFVAVVFVQLEAQSTSLHTNCRIGLWIEVVRPPENLGGNLIFLQWYARLSECVVG
jgi:hypothetical protein